MLSSVTANTATVIPVTAVAIVAAVATTPMLQDTWTRLFVLALHLTIVRHSNRVVFTPASFYCRSL